MRAGRCGRWATTSPGSSRTRNGRLRAINPEAGFFGVAPGTSAKTNPNAMATLSRNTIFTNVALTPEGGVWWEGMTDEPPAECLDWQGKHWTPEIAARRPARRRRIPTRGSPRPHRSARRSIRRGRIPQGVPISAIIFGGRRATHDAAGLPGLQLERRRLRRRHHGLGDDGGGGGRAGQGAPRSHGDAAVLRLSHGRLFPALDQDAALAEHARRASFT